MKKAICLIGSVALCAALLAGCGQSGAPAETAADAVKQSASAWLTAEDDEGRFLAKVDLTGGYSVEFASGAVYLYDQEIVDGETESVAMAVSLGEEVYNEYMDEANQSDTYREVDGAYVAYVNGSDEASYLVQVGENGFVLITMDQGDDSDDLFARFAFEEE